MCSLIVLALHVIIIIVQTQACAITCLSTFVAVSCSSRVGHKGILSGVMTHEFIHFLIQLLNLLVQSNTIHLYYGKMSNESLCE